MMANRLTLFFHLPRQLLLILCALSSVGSSVSSAQISADRLFPPAAAIGVTTTIQAEGEFPGWPADCYCDRPSLRIEAGKQPGELMIHVPADEAPGVAWIRLFNAASATSLLPLMIEPQVVNEQEPNDSLEAPQSIQPPTMVCGRLEKNEDVDGYRVAVSAGQTLVASLVGHQLLGSPMDAVLQVVDQQGNVLAQVDDERGLDPQLAYVSPVDQELLVRVFAFPETPNSTIGFAGGSAYVYALRLTVGPFLDHSLPLFYSDGAPLVGTSAFALQGWNLPEEPTIALFPSSLISPPTLYLKDGLGWQWLTDGGLGSFTSYQASTSADKIGIEELPAVVSGQILRPTEISRCSLSVEEGQMYRAEVHSRAFGFPLDSVLRVIDTATNRELAKADDLSRSNYDAAVEFKPQASGQVELQVSDLADSASLRHTFAIYVYEVTPKVTLTVPADHFALTAGGSLELAVTVQRRQGFDKRLQLTARDLPPGVSCATVVSEPSGESSKSVKLKLVADQDAAAFQGEFRIDGQVVAEGSEIDADSTVVEAAYELRPQVLLKRFWLSLGAAAEKQG